MESVGFIYQLFWLLFIFMFLFPLIQAQTLQWARERIIKSIEAKNNSRVITLIHRQESRSLFGFFFMRMITIEDSEAVLRAIRLTPSNMPIDFIIHTPGGLALAATQIANALAEHKAKVRVIVPHYAMSGGTLIALAADEIVMDHFAVLGPVDPQLGQEPAASIVKIEQLKEPKDIDDQTLVKIDMSKKALKQMHDTVKHILMKKGFSEEKADFIATELSQGKWTHDYPLTVNYLKELGLNISTDMPEEVYALMDLYPQPSGIPSVQYIPQPYSKEFKR
ncbi:enoyl-CoA hydratase-related protein [Venenivibrio stagnispumantis]|uniref:Serine protease, ClpP class n=1 Tax=Venenivibrio stagnispumantis TaxID=407998 RepID=A0AA45WQG2_9AQUI|nr:ATP-dependent Clp protease proteolytic subunit [Venenivibrio stagnispumantis]MCW4574080.1 ATP-dependent Clp protease proteolytic subunit [Venenivibrio stagnispumantis]SMP24790.1 serine protease, ClpP class [Venenivibrio stagnispumantis]